ncbi:hypothetical protein ON010_g15398 [Phytophthora cinnamomi]|nr:hypothetical protein ON010_g15398 [Phytophthora cinnamomi]
MKQQGAGKSVKEMFPKRKTRKGFYSDDDGSGSESDEKTAFNRSQGRAFSSQSPFMLGGGVRHWRRRGAGRRPPTAAALVHPAAQVQEQRRGAGRRHAALLLRHAQHGHVHADWQVAGAHYAQPARDPVRRAVSHLVHGHLAPGHVPPLPAGVLRARNGPGVRAQAQARDLDVAGHG